MTAQHARIMQAIYDNSPDLQAAEQARLLEQPNRPPMERMLTPGAFPIYLVSIDAMGNLVVTSTRQGGTILTAVEVDLFDRDEVARAVSDAIAADRSHLFQMGDK